MIHKIVADLEIIEREILALIGLGWVIIIFVQGWRQVFKKKKKSMT